MGAGGAKAFAQHLPQELRELCLDFRDCRLPIAGIRALAQHLPRGLQQLRLQLGGSDLISSDCKVIMCQLPLESLRVLQLGFESCPLGLLGARAIAEALPQDLDALHLDLDWCNIQAEGAIALAQHLPPKVLRLWLGLGGCSIGREGAQALARALTYMSKLERLHLDCSRCRISFLGAKNLLEVMPNSLTSLLCDFRGCGIDVEERQDLRDMLPEALSVSSIMF